MSKPILLFDGDCTFCRVWIAVWRRMTADRVDYAPYQDAGKNFPDIPLEKFQSAVQFVRSDGRVFSAAEAVFRSLAENPRHRGWSWLYDRVPGFAPASEAAYRLVAAHRPFFSRLTTLIWGRVFQPSSFIIARWIFLRLMGLVYLAAFLSLGSQVLGLIGHDGILSAQDFLSAVKQQIGVSRFWLAPTVFWWDAGDSILRIVCVAGSVVAALLALGVAPALMLVINWILFLSLVTVGGDFLSFQWDALLLEVGFLAIFLPTLELRPSFQKKPPSSLVLWLLRWLLFRLMFSSGAVKLLSGDPSWRHLTALCFHYETQPLPAVLGWYVHHLPAWFQKLSAVVMFVIEMAVPILVFFPRRPRFTAAMTLIFLQVFIALTGNYAYFNVLTIGLCLLLVDDSQWPAPLRQWFAGGAEEKRIWTWPRWITAPLLVLLMLATVPIFMGRIVGMRLPRWAMAVPQAAAPFRVANTYGLFAVMTTSRPEIIVQGSADGKIWIDYEFKYKPGDLKRRPGYVAPHQPRLDWQMWFAALSEVRQNQWFVNFMIRLLQGSDDVTRLLKKNPFPKNPPRFIRAVRRVYHFTTIAEKRAHGDWWKSEGETLYCPVLMLQNGRAMVVQGFPQ